MKKLLSVLALFSVVGMSAQTLQFRNTSGLMIWDVLFKDEYGNKTTVPVSVNLSVKVPSGSVEFCIQTVHAYKNVEKKGVNAKIISELIPLMDTEDKEFKVFCTDRGISLSNHSVLLLDEL